MRTGRTRHRLSVVMVLIMVCGLLIAFSTSALAAITITVQPKDVSIKTGQTASFTAKAKNATGITWRLVSPDESEIILVKDVQTYFPKVKVSGRNAETMKLEHVPAQMDGWMVFCTFGGGNSRVETNRATIHITDAPHTEESKQEPISAAADALALAAYGVNVEAFGNAIDTPYDFDDMGSMDFSVTAKGSVEYWVINGSRYDFEPVPTQIIITGLDYPLTIEAVAKGKKSETLLTEAEIQERRTGETLLVTSKNAQICHVKANGYGAGGWMNEFDFTKDFRNRATEKTEKGGRVTINVQARIPSGKKVSYWELNGVKWSFNRNVEEFAVKYLCQTMEYRAVFGNSKATDKPTKTTAPEQPTVTIAPTTTPRPARTPRPLPNITPPRVTTPTITTRPRRTLAPTASPTIGPILRPTLRPLPTISLPTLPPRVIIPGRP